MSQLDVYLFGHLEVYRNGALVADLAHQKAGTLLCILLLNRQCPQSREALAEMLWSGADSEPARKNIRTILWRLRRSLEPEAADRDLYLNATAESIAFNSESDYWLDVEVFESLVERIPGEDEASCAARLGRAVDLYRGDLLESCYDDWCLYERDRLQKLFFTAIDDLMAYHGRQREYDEAIRLGQVVLRHDRVQEQVHRDIMRLHYLAGRRGMALQQYAHCREVLKQELGVEPMRETQSLYEQILQEQPLTGQARRSGAPAPRPVGVGPEAALREALGRLEEATAQLREALALLGRASGEPGRAGSPLARARSSNGSLRLKRAGG